MHKVLYIKKYMVMKWPFGLIDKLSLFMPHHSLRPKLRMHLCNNCTVSRGPRWICTSHFSMLLRFRYISFMLEKNNYLRTRFQNTWWSLMITLNRTLKRPSRVLILHTMPISCPTQEMHLWHLLTGKHPSMSGTTCIIPCISKSAIRNRFA